ncbi:type II toxin-antitoxin system RelE/ParE family toxin [Xanthomonas campestris pv. campestris]|uniref:type II toxin-antitoxin system RelE/ParE family toxin n=1 Tax=Xanthomonas campestris TaxID=339 RepID=UPI001E400E0D|nr:type II toxin-antitoxin system RelE/ParE family toxin [Xanthomonas campestris]MCD0253141.1 type II toxin-antitoxin system RelE/ParE family toxin [Xanthomonas campestris pv. campestris]
MQENENRSKTVTRVRYLDLSNKAVVRELAGLPEKVRDQFLVSLDMVCQGLVPALKQEKLHAAGEGVIELKINGSPAYRCMYVVRKNGDVVVLHAASKTTQGQDKQLVSTTKQRLKRLGPDRWP